MQALPIIAFAAVFILVALALPFFAEGEMPRRARQLLHLSGLGIAVGAFIFLIPLVVNAGQLVPDGFEWPVGRVDDAVETESGQFVVSHNPSGRIQVYDQDLKFVTGWHINSDGGTSRLAAPVGEGDVVDVYVVRSDERSRYSLDGTLLAKEPYTRAELSLVETGDRSVAIPIKWWNWPLTSPAWGMLFVAPGIVGQVMITRRHDVTMPFTVQHHRRT